MYSRAMSTQRSMAYAIASLSCIAGRRPAACSRATLSRQRVASTGHGTGACGHCAQCASSAPSGPVHPHRAGQCAPIAEMTRRTAELAAGSPRHAPPQRGHCCCLGSASVAQLAQHKWPPATETGGGRGFV